MSVAVPHYRFTVDDFARMVDSGILTEDDRVELIDGEIRQMSPIGSLHSGLVNRLVRLLTVQLGDRAIVSVQSPVVLSDYSEPQPDVLVLKPRDDFYADSHPRPADVLLLIEVADSTLEYDRDEKIPQYAESQIPEVWLVDANQREVARHARPKGNRYQHIRAFEPGEEVVAQEIESLRLSVAELFPLPTGKER
jgi:Uma2 family endonuclease